MLAEHQLALLQPNRLRRHDLVRRLLLQHAVLVNAGLMRESVGADDRLVPRHDHAGQLADEAAGAGNFRQHQTRLGAEKFAPRLKGHGDFLDRRISRAFADSVDRALDLIRSVLNGR
ncbi:hypothetical protein D3C71_1659360 [compost metagenome]